MIFLIQSPHGWESVWQRPHHLAMRFARAGHFVRWVEPRYVRWIVAEPRRFFRSHEESIDDRIEVLPVTLVNGERLHGIRRYNCERLAAELNRPLPREAKGPRVLWLYNPHEAHLASEVPHDLLVYDIMDEYSGFPWSPPNIAGEEAELLRDADWVFAGTQALYEAKRAACEGKIACELSGVDVEHFSRARPRPIPIDMKQLREKYPRVLGYAGMIDVRIDQELLSESAKRHRDIGFVLLGPATVDVSKLKATPNIHLLGQKPYDELPSYYHAWDAALIPFVDSHLTRHINPTKMLEYAAAELPVISRSLPDVERFYSEGAFLYKTADEFEKCIAAAIEKNSDEVKAKLAKAIEWAHDRSWEAIAGRMLKQVEQLLKTTKPKDAKAQRTRR